MAVTFDASNSAASATGTSTSFNVTVGNNPNRILVAFFASDTTSDAAVSGTVNGNAMTAVTGTAIIDANANYVRALYYLNPPTGSNTVALNWTGDNESVGEARSYYNVHQVTPITSIQTTFGSTTTSTLTVTGTATDDLAIDFITVNNVSAITLGANQTSRLNLSSGAADGTYARGSDDTERDGSTAMSWSWTGVNRSAQIAFNLEQAPPDSSLSVDNGTLTLSGQDVTLTAVGNEILPVTNASLSFEAQDVLFEVSTPWDEASLALTGQDITLVAGLLVEVDVDSGTLTLTGSDVTLSPDIDFTLDVANAALILAGQDVGFGVSGNTFLAVDSGTLIIMGQEVGVSPSVDIGASGGLVRRRRYRGIRRMLNIGR